MIVTIGSHSWTVSVADNPTAIATGLSGRASITANTGMLFDMRIYATGNITIDMSQMLFPIDVAFLTSSGQIVDIARNVQPLVNYLETHQFGYFMEVNAGELAAVNVDDFAIITQSPASVTALVDPVMATIIPLMIAVMVMGLVKQLVGKKPKAEANPAKIAAQKKVEYAEWIKKDQIRLEKKRTELEEYAKKTAERTGTQFLYLDSNWMGNSSMWFMAPDYPKSIVANSYDDLVGKLIAIRRFR